MFDFNDYFEAKNVSEAISILSSNENAVVIAGGTDLLIKLRERSSKFTNKDVVSIHNLEELKVIEKQGNGDILIGANASFTEIEESDIIKENIPTLEKACSLVGGPQIRNMGTIGGNVANGATSADTAPILFALDAFIVIENKSGKREVLITDFYEGAGKVKLNQGDLITHIKILKANYENFKGDYIKFAVRKAMDIANLSCAVLVKYSENKFESLKISYGVAAPTPIRALEAEQFSKGLIINEENINLIAEKCLQCSKARDSWRASKSFREHLMKNLAKRAIYEALGGAL